MSRSTADADRRYPPAHREDRVEVVHGHAVADPYRWLEDVDSAETLAWVAAQNALTAAYLAANRAVPGLVKRLTELWTVDACGVPVRRGGRLFYTYREGLANQPQLVWQEGLDGAPNVAIDPNTLSTDGSVALTGWEPSPNGRLVVYGVSEAGSDWQVWRVYDTSAGRILKDEVRWVKFSGASWLPDGSGFFYSRYDTPSDGRAFKDAHFNHKLYLHRLGDDQSADELVCASTEHPDWGFSGRVTDDGHYLVVTIWKGTQRENAIRIAPISDFGPPSSAPPNTTPITVDALPSPAELPTTADLPASTGLGGRPLTRLFEDFAASFWLMGVAEGRLVFLTDHEAPNGRVVSVDPANAGEGAWQVIVPETEDALQDVACASGELVVMHLRHAQSVIDRYGLDGAHRGGANLPGVGTASLLTARAEHAEVFFQFTSFSQPPSVCRLDLATGQVSPFRPQALPFAPEHFTTEQVFVTSKDGTQVPLFLSYRDTLKRDGSHPTCLYGYGGFGGATTPTFSAGALAWMEMGGVYAVACLRGGSEYGKSWHMAGTKADKQNVFDDFIAAAEWLCERKITRPERLAIYGGSNGGLLVGACMTQRPDLFAACVPAVGVLDMMRFHRFTIGWAWVSDYGSPDDPDMVGPLLAYSPYHNVRPGVSYPATLIMTGDHDDRVYPAHSFKFAAELQHAQGGPKPVFLRVTSRAGHGMGKPTAKLIEDSAALWAFLADQLMGDPARA